MTADPYPDARVTPTSAPIHIKLCDAHDKCREAKIGADGDKLVIKGDLPANAALQALYDAMFSTTANVERFASSPAANGEVWRYALEAIVNCEGSKELRSCSSSNPATAPSPASKD